MSNDEWEDLRIELEKDGIIAILSRQRYKGDDEKWLLTGFERNEKKKKPLKPYRRLSPSTATHLNSPASEIKWERWSLIYKYRPK